MFPSKCIFMMMIIFKCSTFSLSNEDYHYRNQPQPYPKHEVESISAPEPGWIDPFDMLGERRSRDSLLVQSDVEIHMLQKRCDNYETYLRRFVNLFLNAVELRDGAVLDQSVNLIKLEFLIDGKDINILKDFGQGGSNAPKIEFVSNVFSKIFSQKTPQEKSIFFFSNIVPWFQKAILKIISSPEWTVLSSVLLMLFLTLWIVYKTHSYHFAVFTVLLTIFLAGFGFTWIRMYEEKEVERYINVEMHGAVPKHCSSKSQSMAWYEQMYHRMFGVDCHEFYKSRDVRPMVKISPTEVLAETFSSMIVNPATHIGTAYGNFVTNLINPLPWWLQIVALPITFFIPVIFMTILLAFYFKCRISLSITGFHLVPSWNNPAHNAAVRNDNHYVEDCSRKEISSSQQNSTYSSILDSDAPLFVMNWKGLKKLSSSSLLGDMSAKGIKPESKETLNEDDQSLNDVNEVMENLEEFVESIGSQKAVEEQKKRSIHTCAEGESSLINRKSDHQRTPMIECSDLPSGDRNKIAVNTGKEKHLKDKTT